jgi:hypothetical protein
MSKPIIIAALLASTASMSSAQGTTRPVVELSGWGPQRASLGFGVKHAIRRYPDLNRYKAKTQYVFVLAEPGLAAARLSIGAQTTRNLYPHGRSVRASVLKKYGLGRGNHSETFLGFDFTAKFLGLGPRVGVFQRLSGGPAGVFVFADFGLRP